MICRWTSDDYSFAGSETYRGPACAPFLEGWCEALRMEWGCGWR